MISIRGKRLRRLGLIIIALGIAAIVAVRIQLRPDPDRLLARAYADHQAGRDRAAEATLATLARLRAPTPADRMVRAQVAGALGRDALAELARIPDDDPLAPAAHLLAGWIEVSRGRLRLAEDHFRAVLARDAGATQARRELAYIYALQHRMSALDEQFEALAAQNQLDEKYLLIWGRIRNGIWNPSGDDLGALRKAIAADPEDRMSRLALAEGYLRTNQLDEAEQLLASLCETDPEVRVRRFAIAMARGDHKAAEALTAGVAGSANHPGLLHLRGMLAMSHQDLPTAVRYFRAALAARPTDRGTLFGLGTALKLMGKTEEAEPYLEAARRHDAVGDLMRRAAVSTGPHDPTLPTRLGIACAKAGRRDEARGWLTLAIRDNPLDSGAQQALFHLDHPKAIANSPAH